MNLIVLIVLLLLTIVTSLLRGWAFHVAWGWYVAPTFHLPAISTVVGTGLFLTWQIFTMAPSNKPEPEVEDLVWQAVKESGLVLFALGVAWVMTAAL